MTAFTWLGDEDPGATDVTLFGHSFVKGESVNVTDKTAIEKLKNNPMFSSDKTAKPVEAVEPEPVDPEAGTEKAALKARLRELGETVQGNLSVDTLRERLAKALAS